GLSTSNSASSTSPAAENSLTLSLRSATPATSTSANSARTSTTNSQPSAASVSLIALTATLIWTNHLPGGRQPSTPASTKWPPPIPLGLQPLPPSPRRSPPPLQPRAMTPANPHRSPTIAPTPTSHRW